MFLKILNEKLKFLVNDQQRKCEDQNLLYFILSRVFLDNNIEFHVTCQRNCWKISTMKDFVRFGVLLSIRSVNIGSIQRNSVSSDRLFCWFLVNGEFRFANYDQNHMVLQRGPQKSIVWSYSDTQNVSIILTISTKIYQAKSFPLNENIWSITFDAESNEGPFELVATKIFSNRSKKSISFRDILFGYVLVNQIWKYRYKRYLMVQ